VWLRFTWSPFPFLDTNIHILNIVHGNPKGGLSSCLSNVYYWQRYKMGLVTEEELRARINEVAEARRVHKSCKQNQKKGKRKRELMSQTTLVDRFTVAKMA
jgi:hypothetical protein